MKAKKFFLKGFVLSLTIAVCFFGFVSLLSKHVPAIAEEVEQTASGTLTYSDGAVYEGDILYGRIRNGTGSFSWATGETYSGSWENDSPSGEGKLTWPGLGVYEGSFFNGKREGTGTFTWSYDGEPAEGAPVEYRGEWQADQIGPQGTLTISGIGKYEGSFSKQLRNGVGTFTWLNGDVYTGEWLNDAINGKGTLTLNNGTILEGDFAKGIVKKGIITYSVQDGRVVRQIANGKVQDAVEIQYNNGITVSGKVRKDEFVGNVTIQYPSGDKYVGSIKNGLKDGKGTYTWASGAHYVGSWVNDKMSGNGKYYYGKDETMLSLTGSFLNGKPDGKLVYVAETKLRYQTVWSNGQCTSIVYKK